MTTHDKDVVSALRLAIVGRLGQKRFDLWFGQSTRLDFDGRALAIAGPEKILVDYIRTNFRAHVDAACLEVLGASPAIQYVVDPKLADHAGEHRPAVDGNGHAVATPSLLCVAPSSVALSAVERSSVAPSSVAPSSVVLSSIMMSSAASPPAGHAPARRRFAELSTFVAGEANRLALTSADMAARRTSHLSPLLFYGPTGVGKTHLLEGVWHAARRGPHKRTTLYLSAEQFTTQFLEALRGAGLPNFRRKYRGVDLLLVDDLQFFIGKKSTQVELLHTIDTLMREGRQLVFAADRPPGELPELGRELTTRLQSGMVCRVEPPDYQARLQIVAQLARRMQLELPADVAAFVASHLATHVRAISGALCRLQATSESLRRPVDRAMAHEALADLIQEHSRPVRLPDIEKAVCEVFGIAPSALQADIKGQRVSHPRMLAMWLARKHTRAALSEIGQFFGRRSHSTVVSAQRRIDGWMSAGGDIRLAHRAIPVDEAVRQVERRLAAG